MSERPAHVHDTDTVVWTSSRRQMGHLPASWRAITEWTGQLQIESSLIGTSFILQMGHVPGWTSKMSGWCTQVYEVGKSVAGPAGRACWALSPSDHDTPKTDATRIAQTRGAGMCRFTVSTILMWEKRRSITSARSTRAIECNAARKHSQMRFDVPD